MFNLTENTIVQKTIGYIKPIWYFHFLSINSRSIFIDYKKIAKYKQEYIQYDMEYMSNDAIIWDAAFQGYSIGMLASSKDQLMELNSLTIPSIDIYRFIRKYYGKKWVFYVLAMRLFKLQFYEEIKSFYLTRGVNQISQENFILKYLDFDNKKYTFINNNPLVSIIIPTLNRYKILSDLLADLESQTYKNFEVIVIDQSDDFDRNYYNQYDLKIKLIPQNEKALWLARNRGVLESKSDLLFFLDDDSRIECSWIINHLKCIEYFNADISAGISKSVIGAPIPENYSFFRIADQLDTGNVLIKKHVFKKCGLFDRQFEKQRMGDGEFGMRAYIHGFKSVSNPKAFRIHSKYYEGGLRELGSWDGFRPKKLFDPRPIPSVLYYWRNYWGSKSALMQLIQIIPFSLNPYYLKGKKIGYFISVMVFLVFFPLVIAQVFRSWIYSSRMIKQGPQIDFFD